MSFPYPGVADANALLVGVVDFALRGTVILLGAWLATSLLRKASAATRHAVWTSAIAAVLVLPVLSAVVPAWNVPVFTISAKTDVGPVVSNPASPASRSGPVEATSQNNAVITAPSIQESASDNVSRGAAAWSALTWNRALALLWLGVTLLMIVRLAVANARLQSWRRTARLVEDSRWLALLRRLSKQYDIQRPVVLLESDETDVPVTWGIVYPVVLLPAVAHDWDDEQRVAVLTHELAHVKRFDALSQLLAQLALGLLWFNPLVWVAVRRMRLEREHACDDFVLVAAGARASRYADDLLGLARRLSRPTAPAAAALAMARRSELEGRLLAILDPALKRTAVRRARVTLLTAAVIVLATPLAAFQPATRVKTITPSISTNEQIPSSPAKQTALAVPPAAKPAATTPPAVFADEPRLEALLQRVKGPPPQPSQLPGVVADSEPQQQPVEVETLIEVARATKKMSSDYEKGVLLAQIAKRYVRNDALRDAYLEAALSMTTDYERGKAIIALIERDSLPSASTARVLRSAISMSSDASRGVVLRRISPATFADTVVQRAYTDVIVAMSSDYERASALGPLIKHRPLALEAQLGVLRVASRISSSNDKANVLVAFLTHQGIAADTVRRAFLKTAETITSDHDYRRVMSAVLK